MEPDGTTESQIGPTRRKHDFGDSALGMVCTRSFPAIVGTADMMLKSAGVTLVGYEKIVIERKKEKSKIKGKKRKDEKKHKY